MRSAFSPAPKSAAISNAAADESYDLMGINLRDPDEIMPAGETPFTINSRMYARNDNETRVANRTRQGCSFLTDAIGSTQNVSDVAASTGDLAFSTTRTIALPLQPTASGALTSIALELKKIGAGTGHVIIEIYTDNGAGLPSTNMIAQSSIYANTISTTYAYLKAYFTDAPTLANASLYWAVIYIQDNGSGSYYINQTAAGSVLDLVSLNGQIAWTALNVGAHFKTYLSTSAGITGFTARYPQDNTKNLILFSQGIHLYSVPISTGIPTLVDSTINSSAIKVRFDQGMNNTYWCDGFSGAKGWDGTTVTPVPNAPTANPSNVIIWQNRMFLMTGNRIDFSDLGDYTSWPSTNFFYIPITTPQAADHPTAWGIFQNNLVIFTHLTKYQVIGSNIANFTYKEVVGTKGAISQEAIAIDRNFIWFMADDGQVYRWAGSGADDQLMSDKMQPEFQGIQNLNTVRFHIYRNQLRIYYAKTGIPYNNSMALYDVELQQWFMDTGRNVQGSIDLYLDDNQLVEFSSLVGMLFYGETQFSDLGRKIDYRYWTNYKTYGYHRRTGQSFGGASAKKRIKRFRPIVRTADSDYTMLVGKDMDFANKPDMRQYIVSGGGAKWGAFVWGDGTLWGKAQQIQTAAGMSGRGNFIQYRFERNGVETPVELYGYVALYKMGTQK